MNITLLVVIALMALFGFKGWKKGIIAVAFSLLTVIIAILITSILAPSISNYVEKNTDIGAGVTNTIYESVMGKDSLKDTLSEYENVPIDAKNVQEKKAVFDEGLKELLENANIPQALVEEISNNSTVEYISQIVDDETASVKATVVKAFAENIAHIIINSCTYFIVFLIINIILKLVAKITNIIAMLPVIKQLNSSLGLVIGLAEGLFIIWILFIAITAMGNNDFFATVINDISENAVLSFLYNSNPMMKWFL